MQISIERSQVRARHVGAVAMDAKEVTEAAMAELARFGINIEMRHVRNMVNALVMDSVDVNPLSPLTTASITTPIQFLQTFLPGFVRAISQARKIDLILGISTVGSFEDEEVIQGIVEPVGEAVPYTDYGNVPFASWNVNYERRTVVRFESGISVGVLEEARASRIKISTAAEKRTSASLSLEISRNRVGFFGYNNGLNRTYGLLNDPALPGYVTLALGAKGTTKWSDKTFLEITADLRTLFADLRIQSRDTIDPMEVDTTFVLATGVTEFLTTTNDVGSLSVEGWLKENYPKCRTISCPEFINANGGANAGYLFAEAVDDGATDDSRTFIQVVPAKFQTLGVEKRTKSYVEDYANATAGVMCKRPYAVIRASGF